MNCSNILKRKFYVFSRRYTNSNNSNKSKYELAVDNYRLNFAKQEKRNKTYKILYYLLGISFGCFYINYIGKASGLFKTLKIDKKYEEHIKNTQEKHNIDQEKIDLMIQKFDDKYEINKKINDRDERLKYGNKTLNERLETKIEEVNSNIQEFNQRTTIDLNNNDMKEKEFLIEDYNKYGENIVYTKNKEFEQLKILQGREEEENPDPRIMGNTIIFDSRFNKK